MSSERYLTRNPFTARAAIGLAVCVLALPAPAFGQVTEPLKHGQQISVTLDARHFGNVLRTNEDFARTRNRPTSDQRITASLDVVLARNLGRNTLNVSASAGYDFYRQNTRLNRERLGLEAAAGVNVGPCLIDLDTSIERRQSDLASQAYYERTGISGFRNAETIRSYGVEARCGRSYGLRPMVGYRRTEADNSGELRRLSNYRSQRHRAGLTYSHPMLGRYAVSYDRTKVRYPNRENTPLALLDGFEQEAIRFSGSRDIGTLLRADASVSHVSLKPNNASAERFKGVSWRVAATAYVGPRLMLNLSTESTVSPSLQSASVYSKSRSHEARATYAVSSRTTLGVAASVSKRHHYGSVPFFGPQLDDDTFRRFSANASMKLGYRLSLTLDAGREQRDGTGTFYDFKSNYIGLQARFTM